MKKTSPKGRREAGPAEIGTVRKPWKGRIPIVLVYPNRYAVGMANLGMQSVYRFLNGLESVVCERAFLPGARAGNDEPIRSVESGAELKDFEILAFSVSFENDYENVLCILHRAGLPLLAAHRTPPQPLVVAGGVACFLNPEPLADFIDCFLLGEAEAVLESFLAAFSSGRYRPDLLRHLAAEVPGAYVPSLYRPAYGQDGVLKSFDPLQGAPERVKRPFCENLSRIPTCTAVLSDQAAFQDTYLIEVARGCPHGCRFCTAGYVYRPPRFRPLPLLAQCIREGSGLTDRIGLVGAAVSDLPDLKDLCRVAAETGARISFSSLRTDAIGPELVSVLRENQVKTATLAPDAGSERMRRVINKGITRADILDAVSHLVQGGIPNLRLYFMVGLPTETVDDVEEIITLVTDIKGRFLQSSRVRGRMGDIVVSLNAFVPKPFTPFQWVAMDEEATLKAKIGRVKEGLRRLPNVRVKSDPVRNDILQALLARGDRRVGALLVARSAGAGWPAVLRSARPPVSFHVHRTRSLDERLPWDFIDHGIDKSFLAEEYARALAEKPSPPCPMKNCTRCGVCKTLPPTDVEKQR